MLVPGWTYLRGWRLSAGVLPTEFYGIKPNTCIDLGLTKSVFIGFLRPAHTICSIDIFVENGHKWTCLENLVKDYNAKKKSNDSRSYTNPPKYPWVTNIEPKIRKEFKTVNKDITFTSYKASCVKTNRSYYLIIILQCTSWIVHAMIDILASQRKKYWHVAWNIKKTV